MRNPLKRPRTKRGMALAAGGGVLVIVLGGFLFVYFVLFPTSSPKPFKLASASTSSAAGTSISTTGTSTSASTSAASSGSTSGTWKIASGSQAGYRVREKLAFLPAQSDAVGRTSQITGQAVFQQSGASVTVSSASFDVAVNTLKSDRSQRDKKIHTIGIESDRYPTATFALVKPVLVPRAALAGHPTRTSATGTFDIHGTSRTLTLPIEMVKNGATIEAVGSITFPWSEFNMTAPSVEPFVTVTGHATMEFDLRLRRA